MTGTWWWFWIAFMFLFLLPSVGYGWGYRGWGPPFPSYIQRRRGDLAAMSGRPITFNHTSWGLGGDFVWLVVSIGAIWMMAALFWGWGRW